MRWILKQEPLDSEIAHLSEVLKVEPLLAKLLLLRGIQNYEEARAFFRPSLDDLHDPFLMKDMLKAVDRIELAIQNEERILVFGDYDVDGTTAVALMASYLRTITPYVDTYIPDRYKEGYGVSSAGIDYASDNEMSLIIALDCGIKSVGLVDYAKTKGIDFIICDHHLPGSKIPNAVAVLDPKQDDCNYPYNELCGCGVGFKLIQALSSKRGFTVEDLVPYLDLVATAIGADIVPITGENRVLAYFGLKVINENPRPGIKALMSLYKQSHFSITDIVFKVAPKINAAGRIEHGKFAVALLTDFTLEEALLTAEQIVSFNEERRELDQDITEEALRQIIDHQEINKKSTVVFNPSWHKGVIGIVASRLIETYYRPTLVFTRSGDVLAASARSVKNFDVYEAIEACSEYLIQFGGHMYAAGLTIREDQFDAFKEKFEMVVSSTITEEQLIPELEIDAVVDFSQFTERFSRILKQFEPFGPENLAPVFLTKAVYDTGYIQTLGKDNEHVKMFVKQDATDVGYPAIGFGFGAWKDKLDKRQLFDVVYSLEENKWKETSKLQLQIKDMQLS
ncbi:single-stranded-DNA-specific exonuclease RecJ [Myroides guanonis]|uniref:Single-stranded-DNA-specific exonuclease RecJ n=1 Tax=Myroides guanonis TaxID=1150112 RepID=A0A1I3T6H3_9FLAO|nr:single-stranded-DNA-specific exonuclease RecJ [Myroides guanonis]SFJ65411.1 exonuclease RecJ [Myroides guanonis]